MNGSTRWHWWLLALLLSVGVMLANVRFVQLAFEYDGECVPHTATGNTEAGKHRAAKSSC